MIVHSRYLIYFSLSIYSLASYTGTLFNQVHLQTSAEREVPNDQM